MKNLKLSGSILSDEQMKTIVGGKVITCGDTRCNAADCPADNECVKGKGDNECYCRPPDSAESSWW